MFRVVVTVESDGHGGLFNFGWCDDRCSAKDLNSLMHTQKIYPKDTCILHVMCACHPELSATKSNFRTLAKVSQIRRSHTPKPSPSPMSSIMKSLGSSASSRSHHTVSATRDTCRTTERYATFVTKATVASVRQNGSDAIVRAEFQMDWMYHAVEAQEMHDLQVLQVKVGEQELSVLTTSYRSELFVKRLDDHVEFVIRDGPVNLLESHPENWVLLDPQYETHDESIPFLKAELLTKFTTIKRRVVVEVTVDSPVEQLNSEVSNTEVWVRLVTESPFVVTPELHVRLNSDSSQGDGAFTLEGRCTLRNRMRVPFRQAYIAFPLPMIRKAGEGISGKLEEDSLRGFRGKGQAYMPFPSSSAPALLAHEHKWEAEPLIYGNQFPLHDSNPYILVGVSPEDCANLPLTLPAHFDLKNVTIHPKSSVQYHFLRKIVVRDYERFACFSFVHSKDPHRASQSVNVESSPFIEAQAFDTVRFQADELQTHLEGEAASWFPNKMSVCVWSGDRRLITFPSHSRPFWVGQANGMVYLTLYPLKALKCVREASIASIDDNQEEILERVIYNIWNRGPSHTSVLINDEIGWRWKRFSISNSFNMSSIEENAAQSRFVNMQLGAKVTLKKEINAGLEVVYRIGNAPQGNVGSGNGNDGGSGGNNGGGSSDKQDNSSKGGSRKFAKTRETNKSFFGSWLSSS